MSISWVKREEPRPLSPSWPPIFLLLEKQTLPIGIFQTTRHPPPSWTGSSVIASIYKSRAWLEKMSLINVHMHARLLLYTGQWFSGGGAGSQGSFGGVSHAPLAWGGGGETVGKWFYFVFSSLATCYSFPSDWLTDCLVLESLVSDILSGTRF